MLNDAFHARYLIYYYALFFTFLLFLQPLFLNGARSQLSLIDYELGKLILSGQHEEMIVVRKNGMLERFDTIDLGFPIGLEEEIFDFLSQKHIYLKEGDVVVLYTDGITEAENEERQFYGLDRLCEVICQHVDDPAIAIRQAVIADLRSHIGTQKIYDDITLLVLKQK